MKHAFVIPLMVLMLIGVACNSTGSAEPVTDEGRIATSVAETVAAQANLAIEPTPVPAVPTVPPTPIASPTQEVAVEPTPIPPTVVPTPTSPPPTETPALLAIGDALYFGPYAMALTEATIGNSVDYDQFPYAIREGYAYISLVFEYVLTKFDQEAGRFPQNLNQVQVKDKDEDIFPCRVANPQLTFIAIGYGGLLRIYCEVPLTAISTLDNVKFELTASYNQEAPFTFELDKQAEEPMQISVEKEREKHFPMDQPFAMTCGTRYHVEYKLANPQWSDLRENRWGFKSFSVDLLMTNPGKTQAIPIDFGHALFFDGIGNERQFRQRPIDYVLPKPGATGTYQLHYALPPTNMVPLITYWLPGYYEGYDREGCEIRIGDQVYKDEYDYFVIEVETSGG